MIPAVSAASSSAGTLGYLWLAGAANGNLYTTTSTTLANGSWTSRTSSFSTTAINTIASNGTNLYVAAGDTGKLATSPDGITWTQRTSSFGTTRILNVDYGDGYWVAGGDSAKVAYSTDGINWTQITTGITGTVQKVGWGNGTWVIGSSTGNIYTATNPSGTWTSRTSTIANVYNLLYYKGGSIWVAGADTGTTGALASSTDAATWTARTSAVSITQAYCSFVANATVVAAVVQVGASTYDIETSTNGTTWTDRTPAATSGTVNTEAASDDAGLMCVLSGFQVSSDGTTWSTRTDPNSPSISICHSSGTPARR